MGEPYQRTTAGLDQRTASRAMGASATPLRVEVVSQVPNRACKRAWTHIKRSGRIWRPAAGGCGLGRRRNVPCCAESLAGWRHLGRLSSKRPLRYDKTSPTEHSRGSAAPPPCSRQHLADCPHRLLPICTGRAFHCCGPHADACWLQMPRVGILRSDRVSG